MRRVLSVLVLCALAAYVAWWLFHLAHGALPSAPLHAITGLPAPTTGCTRSLLRLLKGDLAGSFAFNPFAVPIALLFAASLAGLAARLVRRRKLILPSAFLYLWLATLSLAWLSKLLGNPRYW
jgi:hypothetical protein